MSQCQSIEPAFAGTSRLYSSGAMDKLSEMQITVIGIGGVGSWCAEALARSAVGSITLIDLDDICISNTNRQIHTTNQTIGKLKVEVMKERLLSINPTCKVKTIIDFVSRDNLSSLISADADYIIDAIDSAKTKAAVVAHCKRNKIKVITTGGAGGQIDPLKITVCDLNKSYQDPLSAKVRNELRRNHGFSRNPKRHYGIECVFSTEQIRYPKDNGDVSYAKQTNFSNKLDCSQGLGASVMVTSTFGMVVVSRVLNKLLSTYKPKD